MKTIFSFLLAIVASLSVQAQFNWQQIQTPTQQKLRTIQFVSDQVGYVGGDSILLKTVDGGLNWTEVEIDSIPINSWHRLDIFDMHWFNEDHGVIMSGVWSGGYETFDGGANWQVLNFANSGFCQTTSLFFFDENNGFAGGAGCFEGHIIEHFQNGTWNTTNEPQAWDSDGWVASIEFRDEGFGLAGTVNGMLLRTSDGGLNWDTVANVAGDSAITDFIFHADGSIRATHHNNVSYGVMISTDGGLTWEADIESATFFYPKMNAAHINQNGNSFIAGLGGFNNEGLIYDDRGGFWNALTLGQPINDIASHSDSITFLVGDSGAIYVNIDPAILGVKDAMELEFNISPNPTADQLQITGLQEPLIGYSIFDATGRTILQDNRTGQATVLDVSNLKAGSYFISIETDNGIGIKRFMKL